MSCLVPGPLVPSLSSSSVISGGSSCWAKLSASMTGLPVTTMFFLRRLQQQVCLGPLRGRKMQIGNDRRNAAVELLREGVPLIVSPQPRFHMTHADAAIVAKHRRGDNGCRVSDHEDPVWRKRARTGSRCVKIGR